MQLASVPKLLTCSVMNAETRNVNDQLVDVALLQWGRVLMNAETAPSLSYQSSKPMLQWGRVLMNAETYTAKVYEGRGH